MKINITVFRDDFENGTHLQTLRTVKKRLLSSGKEVEWSNWCGCLILNDILVLPLHRLARIQATTPKPDLRFLLPAGLDRFRSWSFVCAAFTQSTRMFTRLRSRRAAQGEFICLDPSLLKSCGGESASEAGWMGMSRAPGAQEEGTMGRLCVCAVLCVVPQVWTISVTSTPTASSCPCMWAVTSSPTRASCQMSGRTTESHWSFLWSRYNTQTHTQTNIIDGYLTLRSHSC